MYTQELILIKIITQQGNNSGSVNAHIGKPLKNNAHALVVVWQVLLQYFCSALPSISSSCFQGYVRPSKLTPLPKKYKDNLVHVTRNHISTSIKLVRIKKKKDTNQESYQCPTINVCIKLQCMQEISFLDKEILNGF